MSQHGLTEPVDRVDCDRLPIHTPGSIQPHGTLVVAHPADLTILQTAANTAAILGRTPEGLLGRPLDVLVGGEIAARIKLDTAEPEQPHLFDPLYLKVQAADGGCRP